MIIFSPAPENCIGIVSKFFENSQRYSALFATQGALPVSTTLAAVINYTDGKFATCINDTGGKFSSGNGTAGVVDTSGKFATLSCEV
jgi:hypothetical protein